MKKHILLTCFNILLLALLIVPKSQGQVVIKGSISDVNNKNILLSIYSEGTHQLVPLGSDGKFDAELPRFEECILAIYGSELQPQTYSFNTELNASEPVKLFITLGGERPNRDNIRIDGPKKRYITDGYAYTTEKFNLDNVKDKPKYAVLMSKVSQNLKAFYKDKTLPPEELGLNTTSNDAFIRKSEHRLGQEIFEKLTRKRMQEKNLAIIKANYESDNSKGISRCKIEYAYLKAEATYLKTSYELAKLEYEKEKLIVRRYEKNNQNANTRKMLKADEKQNRLEKEQEIAGITLMNKQADCWELDAQEDLDKELEKGEAANQAFVSAKRLDINNVRMTSRLQNAKKLYKQHNLLANDLTGRDRVVQLANAQKYISQQEEIKLYQAENNLKKWKIKNEQDKIYDRQVDLANTAFLKQRENAFQAEMAYLEHMWHLRDIPSVKGVFDDIYARQNDLLDIVQTNRPEVEEPVEEAEVITDAELLSKIKIESNTREGGRSKKLTFEQDYYEIIENDKGRTYLKNGKPITRITYEFETKRKFGQILENVREEERRKRLWDLFKKRIQ